MDPTSAGRVKVKPCRRRGVTWKAKAESVELAPEIVQVIGVVAEILLDQRRRQRDGQRLHGEAA